MKGNVIKRSLTVLDRDKLIMLLAPTHTSYGTIHEGECLGMKKYFKITGKNPEGDSHIGLIADGTNYNVDVNIMGFENTLGERYGDYIIVDNQSGTVKLFKTVACEMLNNYKNHITLNGSYTTHTTFQFDGKILPQCKKKGVTNLYTDVMNNNAVSSPTITSTGITGYGASEYIYVKINSSDEKFFVDGEPITTISQFAEWLDINPFRIWYEISSPIETDITHTDAGQILLGLHPPKTYKWETDGFMSELCVLRSIDSAFADVRAMVLE